MLNGSSNPRMYFLDDINRTIPLVNNNNNWEAVIPPPSSDSTLIYLFDSSNTEIINTLYPINQSGYFTDYQSLQIDSAYLVVTHKNLLNSARAYAAYRAADYDTCLLYTSDAADD